MPGLTTAFAQGVAASRPAAATSNAGYVYFATDTGILSQSTGSTWTTIGPAVALDALTTKGDVLSRTSSAYARLGVGSNDQVLTADSTASTGLKWATVAGGYTDPLTTRGDLVVRGASTTTRLALGSSGQFLKSDGTDALWAAASSALTQISDQTVSGSVAASISFSSISGSYSHLLLLTQARGDTAANNVRTKVQLNSDSTSGHYEWEYAEFFSANTANGGSTGSAAYLDVGATTAANTGAGVPGQNTLWIPNYAGTTWQKTLTSSYGYDSTGGSSGVLVGTSFGHWTSTSAITTILIFPAAGNWAIGSRFTLYGLT